MDREEWLKNIRNKKLALFGCGNTAISFCLKHFKGSEEDITLCYSNNVKEVEFIVEGIKISDVVRAKAFNQEDNIFIIICSISYVEISEQLVDLGYTPFQDFVTSDFYDVLVSPKRIAVAYGICQLRGTVDCLKNTPSFMEKYTIYYYESYNKRFNLETERLFLTEICDLFLYSKGISQMERIKMEGILGRLNKKCIAIGMPIISFCGYFLKDDIRVNIPNPYSVISRKSPFIAFRFGDEYINSLIDLKCSVYEIYEKVMVYGKNDEKRIRDKCNKELLKLKCIDKNGDIHIAEFIKKMYKKERLFRNETHIENAIAIEYASQICEMLKISFDIGIINEPLMKHSQHIIYPSVHEALELEWDWEHSTYDLFTYNGWEKLSFFEFIEVYVNYCSNIKKMIDRGLIPPEDIKFVKSK